MASDFRVSNIEQERAAAGGGSTPWTIGRRDIFRFGSIAAVGSGALLAGSGAPAQAAAIPPGTAGTSLTVQSVANAVRAARTTRLRNVHLPSTWVPLNGAPAISEAVDEKGTLSLTTAVGVPGEIALRQTISLSRGGGLKIRLKRDLNLAAIRVNVRTNSGTRTYSTNDIGVKGIFPGEWYDLVLPLAGMNSVPITATPTDGEATTALEIRAVPLPATTTVLRLASIAVVEGDPRPGVCFQFDDGRSDTYSTAYPVLKMAGYRGSIAVEYSAVGRPDRCTQTQLDAMYADGWAMMGHHTAQMTTLSESDQRSVHAAAKDYLLSHGFGRGSKHWVWPGGARDARADKIAGEYWETRRGTAATVVGGAIAGQADGSDPSIFYMLRTTAVSLVKSRMEQAARSGGVLVLALHGILEAPTAPEDWALANFQDVVSYARSLGLTCYTYDEVFDQAPQELFAVPYSAEQISLVSTGSVEKLSAPTTTIQPTEAQAGDAVVFEVRRSNKEATNAGARLLKLENNGFLTVGGTTGTLVAGTTTLSSSGVVKTAGNLELYAGSPSSFVSVARGHIQISSGSSAERPDVSGASGVEYFDTTLHKPIWSDGGRWRDALGTQV